MQNSCIAVPYVIIWSIYIRLYCTSKNRLKEKMRKTVRTYHELNQAVDNKKGDPFGKRHTGIVIASVESSTISMFLTI
jgi:hypothetical protein